MRVRVKVRFLVRVRVKVRFLVRVRVRARVVNVTWTMLLLDCGYDMK